MELYGLSISDEEDPVVDDVRFLEDIMNLNECVANSPNDEEITSLKSQVDGKNTSNLHVTLFSFFLNSAVG